MTLSQYDIASQKRKHQKNTLALAYHWRTALPSDTFGGELGSEPAADNIIIANTCKVQTLGRVEIMQIWHPLLLSLKM